MVRGYEIAAAIVVDNGLCWLRDADGRELQLAARAALTALGLPRVVQPVVGGLKAIRAYDKILRRAP